MSSKHLAIGGGLVMLSALLLLIHNPFSEIDPWVFAYLPFVLLPFGVIALHTGIVFMRIERDSTSVD
jgi:hypothetical protein